MRSSTSRRLAICLALAVGAMALQPGIASAAPTNDAFTDAQTLVGTSGNTEGNTTGATVETGEPSHAGYASQRSVWYEWTSPATSGSFSLYVDQFTWYPTLAVYSGSSLSNLTAVKSAVSNSSYYWYYQDYASLYFNTTPNTTYYIAVDSRYGYETFHKLYWDFYGSAPANDAFASAQVVTGASGSTTGRTIQAGTQDFEPVHGGAEASPSIWFNWTAPGDGSVKFDTSTSDFDSVLGVYTGTNLDKLISAGKNDDCTVDDPTSCVSFDATAGRLYRIAVAGYRWNDQGNVVLNWGQVVGNTGPIVTGLFQKLTSLPITADGKVPESTEWTATATNGTIAAYQVQQQTNGGAFVNRTLTSPTAKALKSNLLPGSTYAFRVRAKDSTGVWGEWKTSIPFLVKQKPDTGNGITYNGTWSTQALTGAWGNNVHYTTSVNGSVTFSFYGRNISWIGTKGPSYGSAKVFIDGVYRKTINSYSTVVKKKQTLIRYGWGDVAGNHTITIQNLATAGHPRIDVDAFAWFE